MSRQSGTELGACTFMTLQPPQNPVFVVQQYIVFRE